MSGIDTETKRKLREMGAVPMLEALEAQDEALSALEITWLAVLGTRPDFRSTRALSAAWAEATLGFIHQVSCEDPLTGLASGAHLRARLAERFHGMLTPQDGHAPRLHVTVQNKVSPEVARALQAALSPSIEPRDFAFRGLALHRYRGGPWEFVKSWPFRG